MADVDRAFDERRAAPRVAQHEPLGSEAYELAVNTERLGDARVIALIELLQSGRLRKRLRDGFGYGVGKLGGCASAEGGSAPAPFAGHRFPSLGAVSERSGNCLNARRPGGHGRV